jgi:ABC-type phosphate/phosphonate transport system substrate-binding protein
MKPKRTTQHKSEQWRTKSTLVRIKYLAVSLATVAALVLYASTFSEPVLRVSLVPDDTPSVLRRKFKPLSDYLEQKIGMKIEFRPARDADALIDDLIRNKLDMIRIDSLNLGKAETQGNSWLVVIVRGKVSETNRAESVAGRNDADYRWMVRTDMDANLRHKLTDAFLALDKGNAADKEILELQRAIKFVPDAPGINSTAKVGAP